MTATKEAIGDQKMFSNIYYSLLEIRTHHIKTLKKITDLSQMLCLKK